MIFLMPLQAASLRGLAMKKKQKGPDKIDVFLEELIDCLLIIILILMTRDCPMEAVLFIFGVSFFADWFLHTPDKKESK